MKEIIYEVNILLGQLFQELSKLYLLFVVLRVCFRLRTCLLLHWTLTVSQRISL